MERGLPYTTEQRVEPGLNMSARACKSGGRAHKEGGRVKGGPRGQADVGARTKATKVDEMSKINPTSSLVHPN